MRLRRASPLQRKEDILQRALFRFVWCSSPFALVILIVATVEPKVLLAPSAWAVVLAIPVLGAILDALRLLVRATFKPRKRPALRSLYLGPLVSQQDVRRRVLVRFAWCAILTIVVTSASAVLAGGGDAREVLVSPFTWFVLLGIPVLGGIHDTKTLRKAKGEDN